MKFLRVFLILLVALSLTGCASKFRTYNGPEVTLVQVQKANRKMYLLHGSEVLKSYDIRLGFAPAGHKEVEGDGKTPEGTYLITHRNPNSAFHLSLGISYPDEEDRRVAEALGQSPGGDIFIHGGPRRKVSAQDWTEGCIAVTDREMEVIYSMVNPGTPIQILP
jgi:murein L,D-transpeptidase YafK